MALLIMVARNIVNYTNLLLLLHNSVCISYIWVA